MSSCRKCEMIRPAIMGKKPSLKSAVIISLCSCLAGEGVGAGEGKEIGGGVSRALGGRGNTGRPQDDEGVINTLGASDRESFFS